MKYEWPLPDGRLITRTEYMGERTWVVIRVMHGVYLAGERDANNAVTLLTTPDDGLQYWGAESAAWEAVDKQRRADRE